MLTLNYIRERLAVIETVCAQGDHDQAHSLEDRLHRAVLDAIASGTCEDPRAAAQLAVTTQELPFERWCA